MGVGMVCVVDAAQADAVCEALEEAGEKVSVIGEIIAGEGKVVYE
jgi:phosphoribosylformylglycinamidine cyclo-ligase